MKKLFVISIMILSCMTMTAQIRPGEQQGNPVRDSTIYLGAFKAELNNELNEAQRLLNELRAIAINMPNEADVIKNKRQEFQPMFENFDQNINQLFNILGTVLKTEKEMQSSVVRNIN